MGIILQKEEMLPPQNFPNPGQGMPIPGKPGGLPIPLKHDFPPYLQMLFSARGRLPYVKPMTKKRNRYLDSVMNSHSDIHDQFLNQSAPPTRMKPLEKKELREQQWYDKMKKHITESKEEYKKWNPFEIDGNDKCTEDPYKTIIVANLAYATDEDRLREVFEIYGPIKTIRLIKDKGGNSRGYAFIEYESMRGFKSAFRQADGKKVDSRRVIIDAERGRTTKFWRPRRLGGGRGAYDRRAKSIISRTGERLKTFEKPKSEDGSRS